MASLFEGPMLVKIDGEGRAVGFWNKERQIYAAPRDAFEISNSMWQEWRSNQYTRKWEDGQLVVCDPLPELRENLYPPLAPWKFHAIIALNNLTETLNQAIDSLDPQAKIIVKTKLERVTEYHRDDPLIDQLGGAIGLTSDQIDNIWTQAHDLE